MPFATTWPASGAALPVRMALAKASCRLRSEVMSCLTMPVGGACFRNEHVERRNVGVPFDQRRHVLAALDGRVVHAPHRVADVRRVRVDQDLAIAVTIDRVAGEVNLMHDIARDAGEKL